MKRLLVLTVALALLITATGLLWPMLQAVIGLGARGNIPLQPAKASEPAREAPAE